MLVDVPGYGVITNNKTGEIKADKYTKLIYDYIARSEKYDETCKCFAYCLTLLCSLHRVFVLIDSKKLLTKVDEDIIHLVQRSMKPYQFIFTKCDDIQRCTITLLLQILFDQLSPSTSEQVNTAGEIVGSKLTSYPLYLSRSFLLFCDDDDCGVDSVIVIVFRHHLLKLEGIDLFGDIRTASQHHYQQVLNMIKELNSSELLF
jgi:hypothetical protein